MSFSPEALAALIGLGERFIGVLEHAVDREAEIRLAEVNKLEGDQYVALDAARQAAAVDAMRIAAAASTETAKVFVAAVQADAERVRTRYESENAERAEREARETRRNAEREAFRRSGGGGRYQ